MTDGLDTKPVLAERAQQAEGALTAQHKHPYGGLSALAQSQRVLAAADLTRLTSVTGSLRLATADQLQSLTEANRTIARGIAQSIDFSKIGSVFRTCVDARGLDSAREAQRKWADSLSTAIDLSALGKAIDSSSQLMSLAGAGQEVARTFQKQFVDIGQVVGSISLKLPEIDFGRWAEKLDNWIPRNLQGINDLEVVANIALDEGIPLSWVPRTGLIEAILAADTPKARLLVLIEHQDEILNDCDTALARVDPEIALQCGAAIDALRNGLHGPAQSHASNILDSLIRASFGTKGHGQAIEMSQRDFMDQPLGVAAENLTLRPVFRAYSSWWPSTGTPVPDHFSRNVTCHGIGHPGVIVPSSALVAVMLATSLAVQYMPTKASSP